MISGSTVPAPNRLKRLVAAAVISLCFTPSAHAKSADALPIEIIKDFRNDLYVMAERTGGSVEEWNSLEQQAIEALNASLENAGQDAVLSNERGRNALHVAAADGFLFLLDPLLKDDRLRAEINATDADGMTPYDYAVLALPLTLQACHPESENPFLLVPYMVKLPYYLDRQPFEAILASLERAGADTDLSRARHWWLSKCSNADPAARQGVETSQDLHGSLLDLTEKVLVQKERQDVDKKVELYKELVELMPDRTKPSPEEIKDQIRQFYLEAGMSPPS